MKGKSRKNNLPASTFTEGMETLSRNKVSLLFDPLIFEVRQESYRDKGIDLIVELKQDNAYTNFRFAIQLKSTSQKTKKNSPVSYNVDVKNINYLLNFGMPAYYILYEHSTNIAYIESATTVFKALIGKYGQKTQPKTFSVKFSTQLTAEKLGDIYRETLQMGNLLRRLNTNIASHISGKSSGIVIDEENEVYNVEQNMQFIDQFGIHLLNQHEYQKIIEIEQRTHPRTKGSPMFNLVCGMAYFQQASLFKALEFLKSAQMSDVAFDPSVKSMLTYTMLQARHLLGIIKETEYREGLNQLMESEHLGSYLELEKLFSAFKTGTEDTFIRISTLHQKIGELFRREPDNSHLRIRAYSIILEIEGKQLIHKLPENFMLICGRISDITATSIYEKWKQLDHRHTSRLQSLLKYSIQKYNFQAANNIAMDMVQWEYQKLFIFHVLKNWDRKAFTIFSTLSAEELEASGQQINRVDKIIEGYRMLGDKENILYALSTKCELLSFSGQNAEAEFTINEIAGLIKEYDLNALIGVHGSLVSGDLKHNMFMNSFVKQMKAIYRVAKNSGIGKYFTQPLSADMLELTDKDTKWLDNDTFEFEFPQSC